MVAFLCAHSLLVDMKGRRLIDSKTFESMELYCALLPAPQLDSVAASDNEFAKISADYLKVVKEHFHSTMPKLGVMHHIPTTGPTLHARARRLPHDKLLQAKEEFRKMKEMGWIVDCSSD